MADVVDVVIIDGRSTSSSPSDSPPSCPPEEGVVESGVVDVGASLVVGGKVAAVANVGAARGVNTPVVTTHDPPGGRRAAPHHTRPSRNFVCYSGAS